MNKIKAGDKAPIFNAKNQDNKDISLYSFGNKTIILYFYPKDMTKGCTIENKEFSELIKEFDILDAVIIGISPDSIESHKKFITKENLKQMLISDSTKEIANSYGVWVEKSMYGRKYMGILRSTFIIKDGIIKEAFYNVKSSGHAEKILNMLKNF
ncbi:thioredoxin-dependent thiol peroxidase [Helicobacter sp. MIT 99-5507]|uniref:thioredoxin-dependent thiol peroxidase n=1 Tax=Helicobacter sp. MIT 99-5507 TaxID=152489 RepID=UPI000E1EB79E|nr:thioredoxin-dependent thiol peroxidase [Helicobacter sp. MIT 99-5507]RDU58005.1 thioredoxin-dependent thiol peroxidase [Helicobacter sp. MIT 99-5507]